MTRTSSLPLYVVVCSEDGLYVVGGAFHDRPNADLLAAMLRGFAVVPIEAPAGAGAGDRPFVCQLEHAGVRAFELEPGMGAHAIVRRHGPSDVVWAAGGDAARDTARALLAAAEPTRAPAFVIAAERTSGRAT